MLLRGLKSTITFNVAILLLVAMLLINFVMIIMARQYMIRAEVEKGYLFISTIEKQIFDPQNQGGSKIFLLSTKFDRLLGESNFSCLYILNNELLPLYQEGMGCDLEPQIRQLVIKTIQSVKQQKQFAGPDLGIFFKFHSTAIITRPLFYNGQLKGGAALSIPLNQIYKTLIKTQKLLFIYIVLNALILTTVCFFRLAGIYLSPIERLVKRAEEYQEDDEVLFSVRKEDNELNQLSSALNRMLKRISADKKILRSTVLSLEKANQGLTQAQNEIIQAEKLASVGRLTSGIAHEIGNPIGIVLGYLDLLKEQNNSADEKNEYIRRAEDEINRINTIIRQLLDLSRPAASRPKPVSAHTVIDNTTGVLKYQPTMNKIHIKQKFNAQKHMILADPDQLRQVCLNLLLNAADAIGSGEHSKNGEILISTLVLKKDHQRAIAGKDTLEIIIHDNGPGISAENLQNIFDPFFTTKEPGKGTGLGLSVSFMIIEKMGGSLQAASKIGLGTDLIICLPLLKTD